MLVGRVAEQLELGAVGAEDGAVRRHPPNGDRSVLEEVLELGLAAMRLRQRVLAIAHVHRDTYQAGLDAGHWDSEGTNSSLVMRWKLKRKSLTSVLVNRVVKPACA